jgi:crotonobetainyl-CoA:carnitine CoA-transferase CaiB-like acyl-CoA transferase
MTMLECALFARMLSTERGMVSPNTFLAEAQDGVPLAVQTVPGLVPRFLELLRTIPGCEGMADDPRFATPEARIANEDEYLTRVREAIRTRPSSEWVEVFMQAGVPAVPVNTMEGALHHPQVVNRQGFMEFEVPGLGDMRLPAPPFVIDGQRVTTTKAPVEVGADNVEAMRRFAGYDDERIGELFGISTAAPNGD